MKIPQTDAPANSKAIAHQALKPTAEKLPAAEKLPSYQLLANNSRQVQAQAQLQAAANRYAAGKGVVQRTAVYISFGSPRKVLVPGTDIEDEGTFYKALQEDKYTLEKIEEIMIWMERPGASEWDREMAAFLRERLEGEEDESDEEEKEDEDNDEYEIVEIEEIEEIEESENEENEKEDIATDNSQEIRKKRKLKGKEKEKEVERDKKKRGYLKREASEDEEEEESKQEAADIEWAPAVARGALSFDGAKWWVKGGSNFYSILNQNIDASLLVAKAKVTYTRPLQRYGPAGKDFKEVLDAYGVLIATIGDANIDGTISNEHTAEIADIQSQARAAKRRHETDRQLGIRTYRPEKLDQAYKVDWQQPALSVHGTASSRNMIKTMDIGYQPANAPSPLTLPGENLHDQQLYEPESLHGNGINAVFSLACVINGSPQLVGGDIRFYGSGKTTSSVEEKHEKADKIATMLVDSGQIADVAEYDDGAHAHSEQFMIVEMAQDLTVYDEQMKKILEDIEGSQVTVVALMVDMFSNPNTVCERCYPSLVTFFSTTNWKGKITGRLQAKAGNKVTINNPEVILRVSSSKPFSANASQAIQHAQDSHTVQQGTHDIHFIERVPFKKDQYRK